MLHTYTTFALHLSLVYRRLAEKNVSVPQTGIYSETFFCVSDKAQIKKYINY